MTLTKRQRELLDYLVEYVRENRYSPTYDEIKERFGFKSLSTVYEHLRNLSDKGMIRKTFHQSRSIEILKINDRPRQDRSVTPPAVWLSERADDYPISPMPAGRNPSLAALRRSREFWKVIRDQLLPGDELWTFRSPEATWDQSSGRAGYAVLRGEQVVDGVLTWDDLDESYETSATG